MTTAFSGEIVEEEPKPSPAPEEPPQLPVHPTKKLLKYFKQEIGIFVWATIALIGGNLGQLVIPYYIGKFVDLISQREFGDVYSLTLQLVGVVFVRRSYPLSY